MRTISAAEAEAERLSVEDIYEGSDLGRNEDLGPADTRLDR